ncbi:SCO7613 C-terminal domain-containing membrane protein [Actinacidiphila epipremni]|uniref:Beta-carotene 15,15'-monooxygenase n=1 Tax=Actinacidiphila epipremni TaxID=2053013 RepID=A0ABX0ZJV6_9ACTN|nr:hypothetical protein [Actinacidiphila epipremni]NJP43397.1 hypothetical protein [Actinacidiphila epipremni]
MLLTLGGLLLVLAGMVFVLVNWGRLGIGGRAAVLGGITLAGLAAPWPLRRRGLDATAETASCVGLALVLLDAYAARAAGLAGLDGIGGIGGIGGYGYWAAVTALTAAGAAWYGRVSRSVLVPYAALLLLQLPAPLAAGALHVHATGFAYALLVTACLDAAMAARPAVRHAAGAAAATCTAGAALVAAAVAYSADGYGPALRGCAPLVLAACLGLGAARLTALTPTTRWSCAAPAGLALTAAGAAPLLLALPSGWSPLGEAAPAALLAGVALAWPGTTWWPGELPDRGGSSKGGPGRPERPLVGGLLAAAAFVLGLTGVEVLPLFLRAVAEPLRGARDFPAGWHVAGVVPVVAALLAVVTAAAAVRLRSAPMSLWLTAVACALAAALMLPVAVGGPYPAAVALPTTLAVCAAAVLVRQGPWPTGAITAPWRPAGRPAPPAAPQPTGAATAPWQPAAADRPTSPAPRPAAPGATLRATAVCTLLTAGPVALAWAQPRDAAALAVWGVAAVLAGGLAARGWFTAAAQGFAVVALGVEAVRAGEAAGWPAYVTGFVVLGVAAGTVPVAAALKAGAVEYPGYALGALGVLMTAAHPRELSLALALAGALAAGVALRADRRRAGAAGAAVLLEASVWVRLALAGVHAPEPYTLGVSAVLLALGFVRRRRDPAVSSWAAYGPGLGSTLVPSLFAAWADAHWQRPLLLGLGALAVTLLGAKYRLSAPLLTGGAVLLGDAGHELAPTVVQSLGLLPHWVPVAVAGALLVYVGATYERRLVAARRLRHTFRSLT